MATKKSATSPITLELYGKLTRIALDEVSFSANRLVAGAKGQASIAATTEVGVSDSRDSYFVSVTIEVQALTEDEAKSPMYSAKVKGTGFYSLPEKIAPEDVERVSDQASLRSSLQVYPEVRRIVVGLVAGGGYALRVPIEPDFEEPQVQKTRAKESAPAVEQA
jgi:preprotein translocase subunit SecB